MKCIIPGINIKVFGRAVHSLAKIGEELYVEPDSSGVSFRTVNTARSAFACFHFSSGFFSYYDEGSSGNPTDATEEGVKCKVAMKAFLNVFKSLASLEKNVEKCKLIVDCEEAKLGIQLSCRYGIVKTFNLSFIECEALQAVYDRRSCTNYIQSQSRVLSDVVVNFQSNQEEVTLCVAEEKTVVRNYVDDEPDLAKAIHTVLTMEAGEFDGYNISAEGEVTFCLKEFRAVLTFAEPVNLPVSFYFSNPGSPIIFVCDNKPVFEATFVLATLAKKSDSQIPRSQSNSRQTSESTQNQSLLDSVSKQHKNQLHNLDCSGLSSQAKRSEEVTLNNSKVETPRPSTSSQIKRRRLSSDQCPSPSQSPAVTSNGNLTNGYTSSFKGSSLHKEETTLLEDSCVIPDSPPFLTKTKFFSRCFDSTFDPKSIPGNNKILAEDSDEDT